MKRRDFHKLMAAAVAGLLAVGCSGEPGGTGGAPASPSSSPQPSGSPMSCSSKMGCNDKMKHQNQ